MNDWNVVIERSEDVDGFVVASEIKGLMFARELQEGLGGEAGARGVEVYENIVHDNWQWLAAAGSPQMTEDEGSPAELEESAVEDWLKY